MTLIKSPVLSFLAILLAIFSAPLAFAQATKGAGSSTKFIVMLVTNHEGKTFHKPKGDKEKEAYLKELDNAYQDAKRAFQDEKKEFLKKNPGQKFSKQEPQKPKTKVVKSDLKTFAEAARIAYELDKSLEKSASSKNGNGKSGNGNGNGSSGTTNGSGKNGNGK